MTTAAALLIARMVYNANKRPICHPGGPRKVKQLKEPKWEGNAIPVEAGLKRFSVNAGKKDSFLPKARLSRPSQLLLAILSDAML